MLERYMLKMFNRRAGAEESRPKEIIDRLDIRSGESIADVGSGGGYYAYQFAEKVGDQGRVYAVDVMLNVSLYSFKDKETPFLFYEAKRRVNNWGDFFEKL